MPYKKTIHTRQDKTYRNFLKNKVIFLELLQSFVAEEWATKLTIENLHEEKSKFVLSDFDERESDILYSATINDSKVYFYILLEVQSTIDFSMPIRILSYTWEIWREHIKFIIDKSTLKNPKEEIKKRSFRLPPVIPIVLYNGAEPWTENKKFKDCIANADLFGNYIINFEYLLIDVNSYTKQDLTQLKNVISSIFLLDQKISQQEFINRIEVILTEMIEPNSAYALWMKNWLSVVLNNSVREEVLSIFDSQNKEEVSHMIANINQTIQEEKELAIELGKVIGIEEGLKEGKIIGVEEGLKEGKIIGVEEGLKEGKVIGIEEGKILLVINLLDILDDETLAIKSGLSMQKIAEIRATHTN
ncbi:MAG: hypothetical protein ATN35_11655 [Epulopiscium sp. Nele67-Bin004]|nr:MAG: hypothetical protein ATN35_11655 [Epulopiscium sp. Nele67-Bin004]